MKFLPLLSPLALASLVLTLSSCVTSTPANRRELYNASLADSGPWHDYERRREAESMTGVSAGSAPTVVPGARTRPTAPPPSSALPAGTSPAPAGAGAPVPAADTTGAPPVPVTPPAAAGTGAPAAPEAAAPAPAAPDAVPVPAQ